MEIFGPRFMEIWAFELGRNTLGNVVTAIVIFFLILGIVKIFRQVALTRLSRWAKKTTNKLDDKFIELVSGISGIFYLYFAFYLTAKFFLNFSERGDNIIDGIFIVLVIFEILKITQRIIDFGLENTTLKKNATSLQGAKTIAKIILWAVGGLLVLSNLGFNISALAASLGIGGIAIALAMQNILGDLFSSFTIYFDKPFQVGDYIVVGTDKGIVKKIGLKTTRIQTLHGEELVISNKELTESRVQNYKKLKRRRADFGIGVTYDTPAEKLKKIPDLIKKIIKREKLATYGRTHFTEFGDSSLDFKIMYHIESSDYEQYMNLQERINLAIVEAFEKENIEMAFPTRTIYMKKES